MTQTEKQILSFKEALLFMDVSKSFLYKLTSQGSITFFKPNNGKLYFRKVDLENWMLQNEQKSLASVREEYEEKIFKNGKQCSII